MSWLYSVQYTGAAGFGSGAFYIGNGVIAGFDIYGGRYSGTYDEQGGRFKADVVLSTPDGGQMITGERVPAGAEIPVSVDWPSDFGNGKPQPLMVLGNCVMVALHKMNDIP